MSVDVTKQGELFLRIKATQLEAPYLESFLQTGGPIDAAAAPWDTDFAVSGATVASWAKLRKRGVTDVELTVPTNVAAMPVVVTAASQEGEGARTLCATIPSTMRLNLCTSRMTAAINGSLCPSAAGAGSVLLGTLLAGCSSGGHAQVGLEYSAWKGVSATVGISGAELVWRPRANAADANADADAAPSPSLRDVRVSHVEVSTPPKAQLETLGAAVNSLNAYNEAAWKLRQTIVCPELPTLTKPLFVAPVGIAGQGVAPLHDALERESAIAPKAIGGLLEHGVRAVLADEPNDELTGRDAFEEWLARTSAPGIDAASYGAKDLATATSLVVNAMVQYKYDGRTAIGVTGAAFSMAESWLQMPERTPVDANDCDGSMQLGHALLSAAVKHGASTEAGFLHNVRNVLHPHYTIMGGIVGAAGAEASNVHQSGSGGGGGTDTAPDAPKQGDAEGGVSASAGSAVAPVASMAGHAVTFLWPTVKVADALARGAAIAAADASGPDGPDAPTPTGGGGGGDDALTGAYMRTAFGGTFVPSNTDLQKARELPELAIEGTTPAVGVLWNPNAEMRAQLAHETAIEESAYSKVGSSIARAVQRMHVGGGVASSVADGEQAFTSASIGDAVGGEHKFYRKVVELSVPRSAPLYADSTLRALDKAASQFVVAQPHPKGKGYVAGVSPKDIVKGAYTLLPLATLTGAQAKALDYASDFAALDVMPKRSGPMRLNERQSNALRHSVGVLEALGTDLSGRPADIAFTEHAPAARVQYVLGLATMMNNPLSVEQFASAMRRSAVNGSVRVATIDGLAEYARASADAPVEQAGYFVTVNATVQAADA
jgi:hypothetical protein